MAILASGQVTTAQSDIYVVGPGILSAKIEKVTFFSDDPSSQTAVLFVKPRFDAARKLRQFTLEDTDGGEYLEPGEFLPLGNGDSLQASTSGSTLDFVVFGEETRS